MTLTVLQRELENWKSKAAIAREKALQLEADSAAWKEEWEKAKKDPVVDAMNMAAFNVEIMAERVAHQLEKTMRKIQKQADEVWVECTAILDRAEALVKDFKRRDEGERLGVRVVQWPSPDGEGVQQSIQVWNDGEWREAPIIKISPPSNRPWQAARDVRKAEA